ncbi:putative bifunctional diguanylate cyclase/phosphodiesterase [Oxalobacteraceae bacterium A2-2]
MNDHFPAPQPEAQLHSCLRAMSAIASLGHADFHAKAEAALAIAARLLGLEQGLALWRDNHGAECAALHASGRAREEAAVLRAHAAQFMDCAGVLASDDDPARVAPLGAVRYIGMRIEVAGLPCGYACFATAGPAWRRFSLMDREFVELFCRWLGGAVERWRALQSLADSEARYRSVFRHVHEGIMITDPGGAILEVNAAFSRITGYASEEVVRGNPRMLQSGRQPPEFYRQLWAMLAAEGHWQGEIWNRRKNGEIYAELLSISAITGPDGRVQNYVGTFSDITPQKDYERELEHLAHFDALTGLPNRRLLADRLRQAVLMAARQERGLAVAYLDLDGFKAVNDGHGHEYGDELLLAVAQRMRQAVRDSDTICRLGGDEFVAVLQDLDLDEGCAPLLERLLEACSQPVLVQGRLLQVSASIGVTFYPQREDTDADQLLRQADYAMYQAKTAGRNRYAIFDAEQQRSSANRAATVEALRHALADGQLVLHYQPIINLQSGKPVAVEALVRWQHQQRGLLPPAEFLPDIESNALAGQLGAWVMGEAVRQLAAWQEQGVEIGVSINISSYQLQQPGFVGELRALLARHPSVAPSSVKLEVLETSALEDIAHVSSVIKACAAIGVQFALDDFGTGYSSLLYLKRLPAAQIKIDKGFVQDMLEDPDDLAILQGVLGLAAAFKRETIAEGVESEAHVRMLRQLGCRLGQGYGIARPMPADLLPAWLDGWRYPAYLGGIEPLGPALLPLLAARVEYRAWLQALDGGHGASGPDLCAFLGHVDGLALEGAEGRLAHRVKRLHLRLHALAGRLRLRPAEGGQQLLLAAGSLARSALDELLDSSCRCS